VILITGVLFLQRKGVKRNLGATFSVVDQRLQCGQSHVHEVVDHCVALEDGRVTRQVTKLLQCSDGFEAAERKTANKHESRHCFFSGLQLLYTWNITGLQILLQD